MTVMVNSFQLEITPYYSLMMTLLNKHRKASQPSKNDGLLRWERLSFLLFISIMRMRNPRYFSWMGVINAAAYWKSTGGNMSVLFGQKVARGSMVRKLTSLIPRKDVERKMIARLGMKL